MGTSARVGPTALLLLLGCGAPAAEAPVSPAPIAVQPLATSHVPDVPTRCVRVVAGKTPRATIDLARELLERGCHRELIESLVDPADLSKVLSKMTLDELVQTFVEQGKPADLRKTLDGTRELTPTLDLEAHTAIFNPLFGVLRLHELDGRWYIKN